LGNFPPPFSFFEPFYRYQYRQLANFLVISNEFKFVGNAEGVSFKYGKSIPGKYWEKFTEGHVEE